MTALADRPGTGSQTEPAPGWYSDPARCHQFRYWDGRRWTPGVSDSGFVREDPLPDQPCAPTDERVRPPLRAAGIAVAGLALGAAAAIGLAAGLSAWLPDRDALALGASQAALWTGMLAAVFLVSRRYGTGSVRRDFGVRFRWADLGWGFLLALVARIVTGVVVLLVLLSAGRLNDGNIGGLGSQPLATGVLVLMCLFLVVGAPLVEELFFRGLLLRSLQTRLSVWAAVPLQAVLFSAAHALSSVGILLIAQLVSVLLFGLAAGMVVVRFRRLGPTMIGHAFFNSSVAIALLVVST